MRLAARLKLGFYPLPIREAQRIRTRLNYPEQFSAVDPCVGDGVAFKEVLGSSQTHAYGIEIDAYRAEHAAQLGIKVIQANALTVRCPVESVSLPVRAPHANVRSAGKRAAIIESFMPPS